MFRRHFLNSLAGTALAAGYALPVYAQSQAYPDRPIKVILPIGAGGVADLLMRLITDKINMGQPFVLENRPGAGGNIGMDAVARAAPDGYTLLLNGPSSAINGALYKKLSFDPVKDFVPVSMVATAPFAVFISGTLPVNNLAQFIAYAKANPGKLNYASIGTGSAGHLSAVLFTAAAGIDMVHVPYKSIQAASVDLVAGNVQLVFNAYPPLAPLLPGGKLKLLGFSSLKRLQAYPDVPTLSESGLPGFETGGWYLFAVPTGTPPDIQQRLNTEFVQAINLPEVSEGIIKAGFVPLPLGLADTNRFFLKEVENWGRAVKASGARAD